MAKTRAKRSFHEAHHHLLPVETDLRFWLVHALHWHALLLAVVGILFFGKTFFGPMPF